MNQIIALIGNPNCGKTTLFNNLTGTYQKVGNWTGVTTEKKIGRYIKDKSLQLVDLPGIYSLDAISPDQKNALKYLTKTPPQAIINVVDGTNLERNLSLTIELCALKIPMVVAVNFSDRLEKDGIKINTENLSTLLGVPVVFVSALKQKNLEKLVQIARTIDKKPCLIDLTSEKGKDETVKRFLYITRHIDSIVKKEPKTTQSVSIIMDKFFMHKVWGLPIFFTIMTLVYFLSIKVGGLLGGVVENVFSELSACFSNVLIKKNVYPFVVSLVCEAVMGSLGGILSFLPQILILFALMACIEESGYASRVAFLFDRFFRLFGLGGKSLLPLIVSSGCTATGLMSTRIIEGESERKMTIFLSPFIPCGAKTAVFAFFASKIFNGNALVASSMYFLGILCVGVFGFILKRFKAFRNNRDDFLLEIPTMRLPSLKDVYMVLKEKIKEFITRAGLIVFSVSIFLWLLKNVGVSGYVAGNVEKSFLYAFGNLLKYLFYPIGCCNWQIGIAVISGSFAKEAVVESLCLLTDDVSTLFNGVYSAYAFMAFILLSPPCIASLATAKRELGSKKWFLGMLLFQTATAYTVAVIINVIGFIFDVFGGLILSIIIVIIISLSLIVAIKTSKNNSCNACKCGCVGDNKCRNKEKHFTI